jgi:hypothetical protein
MELSPHDLEIITRAERAVRRDKYSKPIVLACFLALILLVALSPSSSQEPPVLIMLALVCGASMLQPPRSPSYAELVQLLSKHKNSRDPLMDSLTRTN